MFGKSKLFSQKNSCLFCSEIVPKIVSLIFLALSKYFFCLSLKTKKKNLTSWTISGSTVFSSNLVPEE